MNFKRHLCVAVYALTLCLFPASVFATNGINLLASSALGQGRAGATTAIGAAGSDSLLENPSLLKPQGPDGRTFELSLTSLFLNVNSKNSEAVPFGGTGQERSSAKKYVPIPTLSYEQKLSEKLTLGLGVVAEAGLSSDQNGNTELLELKPEYSVIKIPVAFAYETPYARVGIAPLLGVARYSTNYSETIGTKSQSARGLKNALGYGLVLGASRDFGDHAVGMGYRTKSSFKLKEFADLDAFGPNASVGLDEITLESPAQWSLGYAFKGISGWTFLVDAKRIEWGKARGFQDYGWKNQWVGALAIERQLGMHQLRAGFNLSSAVYKSQKGRSASGSVDLQGHSVYESNLDFFNVVGYPAILTKTASFGGTFALSEAYLDFAVLHSFNETITRSGTGAFNLPYSYETNISFTTFVASYRRDF